MAIFGFLDKKEEKEVENSKYDPKGTVLRGPGGKFMSKKKIEESSIPHKKKSVSSPKGPVVTTFFGREVRRYYWQKKWYFSVEDVLLIGSAEPVLPPYKELKNKKGVKEILEKNVETISEIPCATAENTIESIRFLKLKFPGPIVDWLTDTAKFPYTAPVVEKQN
jgi:hypothetical protein